MTAPRYTRTPLESSKETIHCDPVENNSVGCLHFTKNLIHPRANPPRGIGTRVFSYRPSELTRRTNPSRRVNVVPFWTASNSAPVTNSISRYRGFPILYYA